MRDETTKKKNIYSRQGSIGFVRLRTWLSRFFKPPGLNLKLTLREQRKVDSFSADR